MELTAQHFEQFMNRRVLVLLVSGQTHSGRLKDQNWSTQTVGFEAEPTSESITYTIHKYISPTAFAGIWDHDPLWNDCLHCKAAPGNPCRDNDTGEIEAETHSKRTAVAHLEHFRAVEEVARRERDELAAKAQHAAGPVVYC